MVKQAYLNTNIRSVVQDPVDKHHGIRYERDLVVVKYNSGRSHTLNTSSGELILGDFQDEYPVVIALVGYGVFKAKKFAPRVAPQKDEFDSFPTMFELERITTEPISINGLVKLVSDWTVAIKDDYFEEQERLVHRLMVAYQEAVGSSPLKKPVLEGVYEAMRKKNNSLLEVIADPNTEDVIRRIRQGLIYERKDFEAAFGNQLFNRLRQEHGEPQYHN
ncbi:hypothetical protein HYY69_00770 [Candidatus Woesearchaeota archaeon]|nr:hypothetical protein [Candidatus Woesearchaeota archaeon]